MSMRVDRIRANRTSMASLRQRIQQGLSLLQIERVKAFGAAPCSSPRAVPQDFLAAGPRRAGESTPCEECRPPTESDNRGDDIRIDLLRARE